MPEIIVQKEIPESDTVRHLYLIQLNLELLNCTRKEIFDAMQAEGIGVNVHYIPTYYFPYYRDNGYEKGSCPKAEHLYERIISIPLYYSLTEEEQDKIILVIRRILDYYKK